MPDLGFRAEGVEAVAYAAAPQLVFKLRVTNTPANEPIHAIALRCQLRIDPTARTYTPGDKARLVELFGEPSRWGQTLRSMLWTHAAAMVPAFEGEARFDLPVPCTFDFNIGATKYFYALETGDIVVKLLFSGTIFYEGPAGSLQVAQVPWDRETEYRLPAAVWREMMAQYYPNSAWLCLPQDVFDRLYRFKSANGLPTWEQALERLLPAEASP
ncbi:DUF6084 family protein [Fimbriiglobus ruber]|uniref:Uncharacterized protein n=1 Tax=Fimbriiglobus ruber TaxID=1908690 RepID=A0A225E5C5_9BACT|nr:DUF6084 family protein [Fimbriiglobus ruber]OWK45306.1 hypothetical protein FRUB_01637 [Fimbriiglobus ruber]